uniref:Uncharacterized protein n=1 Tax=Aegilops tauschii subsp. strangulata TaxID=200361 RepID=A0A453LNR5_AEGTS
MSSRTCRAGAGVVVSATRSPGLGNAGNLREGSNLSKNWDLSRQIGDEHGVLIECRDVHKSFGDKHVLQGVSFKVSPCRSLYVFRLLTNCFGSVPIGHYFEPTIHYRVLRHLQRLPLKRTLYLSTDWSGPVCGH